MAIPRMVEVQLVFTGICTFLRGEDGWPAAVMPNARQDMHHPHIPWMIINKRNWDGSVKFDEERGDLGAWFLANEDMWLESSTQGAVTKYDDHDYGEQPTPGNAASIHWVTPAGRVLEKPPELEAAYLAPGDPKATAQWFHLPEGVLRTAAVRDCVWDLKAEAPGSKPVLTQALAQEVALVTQVPALDTVTLASIDMDTKQGIRRTLILDGSDTIRVLLGNTPLEDVFPDNTPPEEKDHHFYIYRRMFKDAPDHSHWPIPNKVIGRCPDAAAVLALRQPLAPERLGGHNCPPLLTF